MVVATGKRRWSCGGPGRLCTWVCEQGRGAGDGQKKKRRGAVLGWERKRGKEKGKERGNDKGGGLGGGDGSAQGRKGRGDSVGDSKARMMKKGQGWEGKILVQGKRIDLTVESQTVAMVMSLWVSGG
ncbi:hypothetical protein V6Z11_D05G345600 [Gossypium hirsutum]